MKEQIIYYDTLRGCYCVTPRENYEAHLTDARSVVQCSDFASAEHCTTARELLIRAS